MKDKVERRERLVVCYSRMEKGSVGGWKRRKMKGKPLFE